ncbi:MAG: hypothetical protein ACI4QE_03600, partial [Acutalibacteraceae bacterium]
KKICSLVMVFLLSVFLVGCETREETKEITKFSDDIYSFKVKLDGVIYKVPCDYYYFCDRGWEMYENSAIKLTDVLGFGESAQEVLMQKGDSEITVDFVNTDEKDKKYRDCKIGAVNINPQYVRFELPGGVTNDSTLKEIKKALGEPVSYYLSGNGKRNTMFYTKEGEDQMITIVWDFVNEKIYQVNIKYYK